MEVLISMQIKGWARLASKLPSQSKPLQILLPLLVFFNL
jgi:hypothetical protein